MCCNFPKAAGDGDRVPIYPVYAALHSIAVPPGRHRIEFVYRPSSICMGATLTLLGALTVVVLVIVTLRRGALT